MGRAGSLQDHQAVFWLGGPRRDISAPCEERAEFAVSDPSSSSLRRQRLTATCISIFSRAWPAPQPASVRSIALTPTTAGCSGAQIPTDPVPYGVSHPQLFTLPNQMIRPSAVRT